MSPFDIKINTKFRIPVNLSFFLVDQTIPKVKVADATAQTDKFAALAKPDPSDKNAKRTGRTDAAEKPFLPKKTGRDQGCQVDVTRLISFEAEVGPIVTVLVTKTLEQSLWEVENERELEAMERTRQERFEAGEARKKQREEDFVEREVDVVNEKYARISQALEVDQARKQKEQPLVGGVGEIRVEKPKLNAAQQCLEDYRRSKECRQEVLDEVKLHEWLISRTEAILRKDAGADHAAHKALTLMKAGVEEKIGQVLSARMNALK